MATNFLKSKESPAERPTSRPPGLSSTLCGVGGSRKNLTTAFSSPGRASPTPISCETEKYNLEAEVQEEPQGEIKSILWSHMAQTPLFKHRELLLSWRGPRLFRPGARTEGANSNSLLSPAFLTRQLGIMSQMEAERLAAAGGLRGARVRKKVGFYTLFNKSLPHACIAPLRWH